MVLITQTVNYIKSDKHLRSIVATLEQNNLSSIRINLSKFSYQDILSIIPIINSVFSDKKEFTLYLDLPFPQNKSRIHKFTISSTDNIVNKGEIYTVTNQPDCYNTTEQNTFLLNADSVSGQINDIIFYADGEGMFKVISCKTNSIKMVALNTFLIREGKAIMCGYKQESTSNIQNIVSELEKIDCSKNYLLSFVKNSKDVIDFRTYLKTSSKIIPKIETKQAIENIFEIAEISDALLVARGDLALNVSFSKLDEAIKKISSASQVNNINTIFCTDILKNMNNRIIPERSELFDLIYMKNNNCSEVVLPAMIHFSYDSVHGIRDKYLASEELKNKIKVIQAILD